MAVWVVHIAHTFSCCRWCIPLLVVFGYPLINSVVMSMQNYKLSAPKDIGFNNCPISANYLPTNIRLIMINSIVYVFLSVIVSVYFILGMILALALRKPFSGPRIFQSIVFLPWAFSAFVIGLMFRWSFNGRYKAWSMISCRSLASFTEKIAWLGTPGPSLLVVIFAMIWMGVPFFAIMLLASLQSIPQMSAADIDGSGAINKFFKILPALYQTDDHHHAVIARHLGVQLVDLIVITGGRQASIADPAVLYVYESLLQLRFRLGFCAGCRSDVDPSTML